MKGKEIEIFTKEWKYFQLLEEERKKKKEQYLFWSAAAVDYKRKEQIAIEKKRAEEMKNMFLKPYLDAYGGDINKAAAEVKKARENIKEEREKAQKHFEEIKEDPVEDQATTIESDLMIACYKFGHAKTKEEAAAIATTIDEGIKRLDASPELRKQVNLSPEFMEQARMASSTGHIIEDGLASLDQEIAASQKGETVPDDAHIKNMNNLIKMQLVDPKEIFTIHSKEMDKITQVFDSVKKKSEKKPAKNQEVQKTKKEIKSNNIQKTGPSV